MDTVNKMQNESTLKHGVNLEYMNEYVCEEVLLTIVVCSYMHEKYILECLASINEIPQNKMELIIIDDGSNDSTLKKAKNFPYSNTLPVRIYSKHNSGLVDSLRLGLKLSRGHFIAFIASDDCYDSMGLKSAYDQVLKNPRIDAALFQAVLIGKRNSRRVYGKPMLDFFEGSPISRYLKICTEYPKPMLLQSTLFRAAFLREIGAWSDELELDDWPTFIRVFKAEAEKNSCVQFTPNVVLCKYRVHDGGIHNDLKRHLRVTTQVAIKLTPPQLRMTCLANTYLDIGLAHLRRGHLIQGICTCMKGFIAKPSVMIFEKSLFRMIKYLKKT